MALNGALIVEPNEAWGRSYMDHILALKGDTSERTPQRVREACTILLEAPLPGGEIVALRTQAGDTRIIEAARDVMAHAYALVKRSDP